LHLKYVFRGFSISVTLIECITSFSFCTLIAKSSNPLDLNKYLSICYTVKKTLLMILNIKSKHCGNTVFWFGYCSAFSIWPKVMEPPVFDSYFLGGCMYRYVVSWRIKLHVNYPSFWFWIVHVIKRLACSFGWCMETTYCIMEL
jgi:hypothetical protein